MRSRRFNGLCNVRFLGHSNCLPTSLIGHRREVLVAGPETFTKMCFDPVKGSRGYAAGRLRAYTKREKDRKLNKGMCGRQTDKT